MVSRALCPVLIGRDQPLSLLEDALLAAGRGDSRVVALSGEAGVGKTRMTNELAARARKLGFEIMWGGCSEAELQLPYLPFVEAVGNWLAEQPPGRIAEQLGGARRELAQVFPQLATGDEMPGGGDSGQAKLRFLEAAIGLLSIPAKERGLLLIIEDIHWADSSTRELLDHLARRLGGIRALVLATFRSDEIERRHPLRPVIQSWRRSGTADMIALEPLSPTGVASMIGTILDTDSVSDEFRDLLFERTEGNPFVVEEMLKEALDRGDVYRTNDGWERKPLDQMGIPETVRDTILLRVERLDPSHVPVLQAASVLGRSFDYATLAPLTKEPEDLVEVAIESAIAQQLIEEDTSVPGRFRWRHALTQEAIYTEMMLPKRQHLHSRAADELATRPGTRAGELAHHLMEAGRYAEAVPVCMRTADEAMQTFAYEDSLKALERAVSHAVDETQRARIIGKLGQAALANGESRRAREALTEAVALLEQAGEMREAAAFRTSLSRAAWELLDSDAALRELHLALEVLEPLGPSGELARIHLRLAGLAAFALDFESCIREARLGADTAARAGAEFERVWALGFVGLGVTGAGRIDEGLALIRAAAQEAERKGFPFAVQNTAWNEAWMRTHLMAGQVDAPLAQLRALPDSGTTRTSVHSVLGTHLIRTGDLGRALDEARMSLDLSAQIEMKKSQWRSQILMAEVFYALGRPDEARTYLPEPESLVDAQDYVYAGPVLIGDRLELGDVEGAVRIADRIAERADSLKIYRETLAAAAEAYVAAGRLDRARDMLRARGVESEVGSPFFDFVWGLIHLADNAPGDALTAFRRADDGAAQFGYRIHAIRARIGAAHAAAAAGDAAEAASLAAAAWREARSIDAIGLAGKAAAVAAQTGVLLEDERSDVPAARPAPRVEMGERMVTSLFADIRGYTELTSATPPAAMSDRLTTLYRWAKTEVERQRGIVDKFAGDAVMATFNVAGTSVDHTVHALQAGMALRDKARLTDVGIGVGIAVGPAVVSSTAAGSDNLMVMGESTNLAARLQAAAGPGEIMLSPEAFRRVADWIAERGIVTVAEDLTLKGFEAPVRAYRIRAAAQVRDR